MERLIKRARPFGSAAPEPKSNVAVAALEPKVAFQSLLKTFSSLSLHGALPPRIFNTYIVGQ